MHNPPDKVNIWGGGLIGYTLALLLAAKNIRCCIFDIEYNIIENINHGLHPRLDLQSIIDEPDDIQKKNIHAELADNFVGNDEPEIHILSIPTERSGKPSFGPTEYVLKKIINGSKGTFPIYFIIESTISPSWFSLIHQTFAKYNWQPGVNYHIGASPRRDVFNSKHLKLKDIDKIIGGDSLEVVDIMVYLYDGICKQVHLAKDAKHAMMTKLVENYLRDSCLNVVNTLSAVFDDLDMVEVFSLASTKWNVEKYHPTFGIGGYCIPLAKHYLSDGIVEVETVRKLNNVSLENNNLVYKLDQIVASISPRKVGILGLAYAPSFKIHTYSPTITIIRQLMKHDVDVFVHDPYYNITEIEQITQCKAFTDLACVAEFDLVILVTPHDFYIEHGKYLVDMLQANNAYLVDNFGSLKGLGMESDTYWEVGSKMDF